MLNSNIETLTGVGEKRKLELNNAGIFKIEDLLYTFPKSYEDFTKVYFIKNAPIGALCCIKATIASVLFKTKLRNKPIVYYRLSIFDGETNITATYFASKFSYFSPKKCKNLIFFGQAKINSYEQKEIAIKKILNLENYQKCLHPVYKKIGTINSNFIAKLTKKALLNIKIKETLPNEILTKYNLCSLDFAIKNIHYPESELTLKLSRERLVFEEILNLQLYLYKIKNERTKNTSAKIKTNFLNEFKNLLPFKLTNAQERVILECIRDMSSEYSMKRLLQGDVGSGKTAVAAALCFNIVKSTGAQVAFMAPTEILSRQHYNYLKNLFLKENITVELLCSSVPNRNKKLILENLKNNKISILVGTHSLLNEDIKFNNLGLVITDEQHRFGVNQRAKLANKNNNSANAHVLVMSATPIPRSLALVIYADLYISILDEVPAGRKEIETFIIDPSKRLRALNFIRENIKSGHQAFIVCPLIEETEVKPEPEITEQKASKISNLESVIKYKEKLQNTCLKDLKIEILHGKMKPEEKNFVMERFIKKEIDVLVSTTVIEVGVDVPNANIILIENAERLGLSQLHQLRGRVGRGTTKSFCILVSDSKSKETLKRLYTIKKFKDGFKIAEEDLKQRGPGSFVGTDQHGTLKLKTINFLTDINVFNKAKEAAKEILNKKSTYMNPNTLPKVIKNFSLTI